MNQPGDDRDRGPSALQVAGVGLGLLGATFGGVAGWFTLAPSVTETASTTVSTRTGVNSIEGEGIALAVGNGRPHTRTGGA